MTGPDKTTGRLYIVLAVLAGAAVLFSLALAAALVRGTAEAAPPSPAPALGERFSENLNNLLSGQLDGLSYVRKRYSIPDGAAAPEPDPACYGETDDPQQVLSVIAAAEELLEGQPIYAWTPDTVYRPGSDLRYYRDDSILALCWHEVVQGVVTTFCEVMISDASQLRRKLAGDAYGCGILKTATSLATEDRAVAAINGDFYSFRGVGIRVWQGRVCLDRSASADSCFFTRAGDMLFARQGELSDWDEAQRFVDENDVGFSLTFGPVLVENSQTTVPWTYPLGEIDQIYARSAIGQLGTRHYLLMTMNFDDQYLTCHTARTAAEVMLQRGCTAAYALDGGQTATLHLGGELMNIPTFGWERPVSDLLCFATAIPNGGAS